MSTVTAFCPHCGNVAQQQLLFSHPYEAVAFFGDGSKTDQGPPGTYYGAACGTCGDFVLYHSLGNDPGVDNFNHGDLVYPKSCYLDSSVPEAIRNCFAEAARIQNLSPNGYAVMIRRALEAICDDRGIARDLLVKRLEALAAKGDIPPSLAKITNALRIVGNTGAHDILQPVTVPQTWAVEAMFRAVVEYVYVAPSMLAKFEMELKRRKTNRD